MGGFARFLFGRPARRRWIHLILGGALAMPYVLLAELLVGPTLGAHYAFGSFSLQVVAFAVGLPLAALTSLFPLTRPMCVAAARALCDVDGERLADGPARGGDARGRTAAWFALHLGLGGVVAGMSLAVPPFAAVLIALPAFVVTRDSRLGFPEFLDETWALVLAPVAGVVTLVALAACAALAGRLLAHWAPALLGPSPEERLAAAEARAEDLAVRNRLARELHDSVGHALSAVTLQASAARRVLDTDPRFVREALAAIEETTRRTVGELDAVLRVLRDTEASAGDDDTSRTAPVPALAPAPTLATDLDGLLHRTRAGGTDVTATVTCDTASLSPPVSREAYRIVQEGLSNALRHTDGRGDVTVRIGTAGTHLEIILENPLHHDAPPRTPPRPGGGHGLRGVADRARLLGGTAEAGPVDSTWRLHVRLPLEAPV
ncbi:histidine kinase [Streptomyces sp. NPDC046862]|uniref:sensor histidine kinase n=1 Tax=Streptomyces sp. NPDC046862 TaxID=3154603 RepID=UPI0034529277